jgi:Uma2 family endonuclease
MSLEVFDRAIGQEGYLYELNKGVIDVSHIPRLSHFRVLDAIRDQLVGYRLAHPGVIYLMGSGAECKVLIGSMESERHPDWSVYLRPPPPGDEQPWSVWIPEIVIEVVSESSHARDYDDKPPEYLALGVSENWIFDPTSKTATFKTRWRGVWRDKVLKPGQSYATHLLPGFKLDLRRVFGSRGSK